MEAANSKLSVLVAASCVKSKCQFCFAFYNDWARTVKHIDTCSFRFSETFIAFDNRIKFACTVCRDVYDTRNELVQHEKVHMLPGGFVCSTCEDVFQNEFERMQHAQTIHHIFKCLLCTGVPFVGEEKFLIGHCKSEHNSENGRFARCMDCGANFELKSYLRAHKETKCGLLRNWNCLKCTPLLSSEDAYNEHVTNHATEERENEKTSNDFVSIKWEVDTMDIPLSESGEPIEDMCSVYIEDPISMAIKYEDQVHSKQYEDNGAGDESDAEQMDVEAVEEVDSISINEKYHETFRDVVDNDDVNHDNDDDDDENASEDNDDGSSNKSTHRPFECDTCGVGYNFEIQLRKHIALHGPDGSLTEKCNCCRLYFASVGEMEEHRNQNHLDDIKCDLCYKIFKGIDQKRKHMRGTHNQKSQRRRYYECSKCDFKIGNRSLLDVHMANNCERILLYKCHFCGAAFDSNSKAKAHRSTHVEMRCEVCDKVYGTLAQLVSHRTTHENRTFTCEYCDRLFLRHAMYLKHLSLHTGINPYKCATCPKRFLTRTDRNNHECKPIAGSDAETDAENDGCDVPDPNKIKWKLTRKHSRYPTKYVCKICNGKFARLSALDKHMPKHGPKGELVHKCKCCPKLFATKEEASKHNIEAHESKLKCDFCTKKFATPEARRYHHRSQHVNDGPVHICSKCGKQFALKSALEDHERSDCGRNPPYSCSICGTEFIARQTFINHMKRHTDGGAKKSETFTCDTCGKILKSKSILQSHMRIHTGEKPYTCYHCGKAFRSPTDHKFHELRHKGVKLYKCEGCGDRFSCNSNLQKHRRARESTCALAPLKSLKTLNREEKRLGQK